MRPSVVAVEVSRCGVLQSACAPAWSTGWKERGQDGPTDDTEEVELAGLTRPIGGKDRVGGDELVASGLQSGGEAGPVGVGVGLCLDRGAVCKLGNNWP